MTEPDNMNRRLRGQPPPEPEPKPDGEPKPAEQTMNDLLRQRRKDRKDTE